MEKQVSRILLYLLVFFTPFLFAQNTNELFEFPKMYFVYFLGSLLIISTIVGRLWETGHSCLKSSLLPGLFVISFVVSTGFSTHPYTSLWGYFTRFNGGLISILIFFGIFLATKHTQPSVKQTLRIISFTLLPISFYAILQHFGLGGKWESDTTVRAFSTFGQPNWYSAYCAMVLPIVLFFALEEKARAVNKVGWIFLFILGFCGFWYSYSISGILGLGVSLGLLSALNFSAVKKNWLVLVITASICLLFAFLNSGIFRQKIDDALTDAISEGGTSFSSRVPALAPDSSKAAPPPITTTSGDKGGYALTDSGFIRKGMWKGSLNLATSSPKNFLIGTGPETFPYEFQKFRPASLNYSSEWNYILNKPHNYYLELLTQNGVVGLLLYLAIVIKVLLSKHRILTPTLIGLFVTNIFSWPTVSTALLFWIFLALMDIDSLSGRRGSSEKTHGRVVFEELPLPHRLACSILLITIYSWLNIQFARQYVADVASKSSAKYFEMGNVQKALELSNRSVKLNSNEPFYYRQRAKTQILETALQDSSTKDFIKALALKDILKARELNPGNLATLRGSVSLYYFLALNNVTNTVKQIPQENIYDPFYLNLAKTYYLDLTSKYPNDVGVTVLVAKYQRLLDLTADYENTVTQIKSLRPDLLEWYLE